jgi:hypothetical protein
MTIPWDRVADVAAVVCLLGGTKPQVLGLMLVLTSPAAAHMVGRAGYRTGKVRSDLLVVDELTADQAHATATWDADDDGSDERQSNGSTHR